MAGEVGFDLDHRDDSKDQLPKFESINCRGCYRRSTGITATKCRVMGNGSQRRIARYFEGRGTIELEVGSREERDAEKEMASV